jgi:hypothetical protein
MRKKGENAATDEGDGVLQPGERVKRYVEETVSTAVVLLSTRGSPSSAK